MIDLRPFWRAFRRNRLAVVGGVVVLVLILLAALAPLLSPWDPHRPDIKKILAEPSRAHPLGTDQLGRDVLSRMLYGARVSLAVGFVSVGIATVILSRARVSWVTDAAASACLATLRSIPPR